MKTQRVEMPGRERKTTRVMGLPMLTTKRRLRPVGKTLGACLKTRPVRPPGLPAAVFFASTGRPRALTRRFGGVLKQALRVRPLALFVLALHFGLQPLVFAQTGATTTWAGGNSFLSWAQAANWNPQIVPLNNPGTNFTVIVPDYTSLSYDASASGLIDALSFGTGSQLLVTNGQSLGVNGVAIIKGQIDARGAGSAFQAPANTIVLSGYPRFLARDGAQVGIGASSYSWANYGGNATLLSAIGTGSLVDLSKISVVQLNYGDSGAWVYSITAQSNGVVDLSGLGNLTGPGSDDVLELNVDTGGLIKLDNVNQVTSGTRFNIGAPGFELPAATLLANSTINVSTGAVFRVAQAASLANSSINVAPDGLFHAPQLSSMDGVPLNLLGNGVFLATNLVSYRNSDIPILPGRDIRTGLLTDIYGSRISVTGGTNYRVGALSYEMPPSQPYYTYPPKNLFSADGAGSLLDLTNTQSTADSILIYAYDTEGNRTRMSVNGAEATYGYDVAGRLHTISNGAGVFA